MTEHYRVSQRNGIPPYEALFGGKLRASLASMNLGELEDGVSAEEQLLETIGDKNAEEVQATLLVECRLTLGRADNKDNADNARLNNTFSCDKNKCQTLEELEPPGGIRNRGGEQLFTMQEAIQMLILVFLHSDDIEDRCLV